MGMDSGFSGIGSPRSSAADAGDSGASGLTLPGSLRLRWAAAISAMLSSLPPRFARRVGARRLIQGTEMETHAEHMERVRGAYRDAVLFNAAATLIVAGRTADWTEGAEIAAEAIDSGRARQLLADWIEMAR